MDKQKRRLTHNRKDSTEEELYPDKKLREDWKRRGFLGGVYSDSEVGGEDQSQQNPWQGSQDLAKSEDP